jgi:XRE family transcriptional regulator, fatty acid utilization regulator
MIGEEVRRQREELGLTGAQLAARAGLAPSAVSQIETGKRSPSSMSVMKLADALGVEVGQLYPKKAQAPLPLEEPEWGVTPGSPFSAERALTLADSDSFRREAKGASVEELQQTALELAAFMKPQTLEEPSSREETYRRVIARERLGIIEGELYLRKAPSPVKLVIKRDNDAMTPTEETTQRAHEEQEARETA